MLLVWICSFPALVSLFLFVSGSFCHGSVLFSLDRNLVCPPRPPSARRPSLSCRRPHGLCSAAVLLLPCCHLHRACPALIAEARGGAESGGGGGACALWEVCRYVTDVGTAECPLCQPMTVASPGMVPAAGPAVMPRINSSSSSSPPLRGRKKARRASTSWQAVMADRSDAC
uniref:Uncharacterized protein n=1 Tax=Arundo donax TaxID=35708 RepID=A0A0A9CXN4_ARUDO